MATANKKKVKTPVKATVKADVKADIEPTIPEPNTEVFGEVSTTEPKGKAEVKDGVQFNALGLESTEDHKHVAKVWQDQCIPFPSTIEKIEKEREGKIDVKKPQSYLRVNDEMVLPGGEKFTHDGLTSMVVKFTNLPVAMMDYLLEKNPADLAKYLNAEMDEVNSKWNSKRERDHEREFLLRLRPDGDGGTAIRMVGSDRYGVFDNHEVIGMLYDAMVTNGHKDLVDKALTSHFWSDLDRMNGNLLLPDSMKSYPDSDYGVGIAFSNSEIGTNVVKITPFLFRAICLNGCIWGRRDSELKINKKHVGEMDFDALKERITYVVATALSEGNNLLTQMEYSREAKIDLNIVPKIVAYLTQENKLTVAESRAWFAAFQSEPWESGYGIVNGLTRAAREYTGQDRWNLEAVAGSILTPSLSASKDSVISKWEKIADRASDLSESVAKRYTEVRV
jgi:hypothetical protein